MQTRKESLTEVVVNLTLGFIIGVVTQAIVFPLFGMYVDLWDNCKIAVIFMLLSIVRSYILRRVYNAIAVKKFKQGVGNDKDV